jgi:acetate---CoA ligase (ADP-forming)
MAPLPSEAILRDGASIVLRTLGPADRDQLVALFGRMSPLSRRHRYCGGKRELTDGELAFLSSPDGVNHVALAATARDQLLGVGRYVATGPGTAEIAFDVADADQGRGIGTLLLEHLARIAQDAGIVRFVAQVEADNDRMLDVFAHCGFVVNNTIDIGLYAIEFDIADTERFLAASAEREREAAARSIRVFFAPRSVAVIGASRKPGTIGRAIVDNLVRDGYRGAIFPVNPNATEIAGRRCYPSVASIGEPVELAVIAVPAADVVNVVKQCAAACVRGVVVITSGFAEIGAVEAERELRAIVRQAGMRMVGPNCLGVLSTDPEVSLDATFSPVFPPRGNISLASQSGALGLTMLDYAKDLQLGIADFVALGNKADVSVNDLLAYWHRDPRTRVIALYLESFGNPRTFARLAPQVARERPIIAVKSGRSAAGTRAASSHSASLACLDIGIDALFAQTGVIRTDTLEQMFDLASLLSSQPIPEGPRIGVVTNAGGPGILLADACEARGLELPQLAGETRAALHALLPATAGLANPIDMTAAAPPEHYAKVIELVGRDPNVDAVVAIYVPPLVTRPEEIAAAIARGAGTVPPHKPIATVFMSSKGTPALLAQGPRGSIPSYSFPENVALALADAVRYGRWRKRPVGTHLELTHEQQQAIRAHVARCRDGWLTLEQIATLLDAVGVRLADFRIVDPDPRAASRAAQELGGRCVLKAIVPGIVHKSDRGGVALDLDDASAVAAAAEVMLGKLPDTSQLIVQRQLPRGIEALVGVATDSVLGPLVVAGIGGTAVELYKDVAFRLPPITDVDAAEMLDQLRGKALFDGFRGSPPADRAALADVIRRIGALVEVVPELVELDLNPVIVFEPGRGAIAADARVRLRRPS